MTATFPGSDDTYSPPDAPQLDVEDWNAKIMADEAESSAMAAVEAATSVEIKVSRGDRERASCPRRSRISREAKEIGPFENSQTPELSG